MIKTAILIDGGFYQKRAYTLFKSKNPQESARELIQYCHRLLHHSKKEDVELYRIFYYDCPPMKKVLYHPFLKKQIDFSKTELYQWMNDFLGEMKLQRKVAVRLGTLADEQARYILKPDILKHLCNGRKSWEDITEDDFILDVRQKGVDMKIGLDIASMAYKKQVDRIILISGDSDFVPAAKLARREGIDFILDPMQAKIKDDLTEHIDGIRSCSKLFEKRNKKEDAVQVGENA